MNKLKKVCNEIRFYGLALLVLVFVFAEATHLVVVARAAVAGQQVKHTPPNPPTGLKQENTSELKDKPTFVGAEAKPADEAKPAESAPAPEPEIKFRPVTDAERLKIRALQVEVLKAQRIAEQAQGAFNQADQALQMEVSNIYAARKITMLQAALCDGPVNSLCASVPKGTIELRPIKKPEPAKK